MADDWDAVIQNAIVEEEGWSETERPCKDRKPAVKWACRPNGAESETPNQLFLPQFVALEPDKPAFVQSLTHAGVFLTTGWPIPFFRDSMVLEDKLWPRIRPRPGT